jgi:hypothetical protein
VALVTNGTSIVRMKCDVPRCLALAVVEGVSMTSARLGVQFDPVKPPSGWVSVLIEGRQRQQFDACNARHALLMFSKLVVNCT